MAGERDLSCVEDLDLGGAEVTEGMVLAQACVRRIMTPRGRLLDDNLYGMTVRDWINEGMTELKVVQLQTAIRLELRKDERVVDAEVRAAWDFNAKRITISIDVQGVELSVSLTLAVDQVSAVLLRVDTLEAA